MDIEKFVDPEVPHQSDEALCKLLRLEVAEWADNPDTFGVRDNNIRRRCYVQAADRIEELNALLSTLLDVLSTAPMSDEVQAVVDDVQRQRDA